MPLNDKSKYWKVVPIINPHSGKHGQEYFFKGIRAKRIPMTSRLAEQMAGFTLIERDLRMVTQWLQAIDAMSARPRDRAGHALTTHDDETHKLVQTLFVASLMFYGKCFADAEGRRIRLDRNWVPFEFKKTHEQMISMRNQFAAHSGSKGYERVQVVLVLPVKDRKIRDSPRLYRELLQTETVVSFEDDDTSFLRLAMLLQRKAVNKLEELNAKIFQEDINPKGMDYWLRLKEF